VNLSTPQLTFSLPRKENCGGQTCGECLDCRHRARVAIASYVLRKRFDERGRSYERSGPEERRYVAGLVMKMLDVAGLSLDTQISLDAIRRSEWGRAMRDRQLTGEQPDASDSP